MRLPAIGALRRRLLVEAATEAADGAGGAIRSWTPLASVWGRIEPRGRGERVADGRATGRVTHRVTIRRRDGIGGGVRFVAGGVRYRVVAVEDLDPARRFLVCLCEEEQA